MIPYILAAVIPSLLFFAVLYLLIKEKRAYSGVIKDLDRERARNQRYIEDLDNLIMMLTRFQEMGMTYTKIDDIEHLCRHILEYATDLVNTKMGSIMLIDRTTNLLEITAARGLAEDVVKTTRMHIGEGIAGRVAQEGKAIYCEDIENDVRFMRHSKVKYTSSSFIAVPLKVKNKVIGVLNVNSKKGGKKFNQRDMKLISVLADQAAVAIENIQLYNDMKQMYLGTIQTLAQAIDAKDPYTRGHTERVTKFAVAIAREMNLPSKLVRNIEFAALIHDIGKIGIKDSVLSKPGSLTNDEYEEIKMHPRIGEEILAPVEFLTNVAPLVLYHHEHYNGDGYLEGLKGEEIPIGARIINVADAFEAMISDRPYSKSMSEAEAVKELKDQSGKQFDPEVVKAFLRVLERNKQRSFDSMGESSETDASGSF